MSKLTYAVLLGLCLLCLQSAVWATIPGHIMLDRISDAFPIADGTVIGFAYKTVTASLTDTGTNYFYIEEPDRSAGIRVYYFSPWPQPIRSHSIIVGGVLNTYGGERVLCMDYLLDTGNNPVITPFAMDNPAVGGMSFNTLTPGITDAQGPYNKGILVRAWGYVGTSDQTGRFFYVDDGSGIDDGSGNGTGIRVNARPGITLPLVGDFVIVTGVSSTYLSAGNNCRMIIARDPADIVVSNTPTTIESKDAIAPGANAIGVPAVPFNNGSGSATPNSVFATTTGYTGTTAQKWNPANQTWRDAAEGYNAVYSDEAYKFDCSSTDILNPLIGNTVSYQAVLGILQQTDRYIPLYAGANGSNWIGYPFMTGMQTSYTTVANGATITSAYYATTQNWMDRYAERWDSLNQGATGLDLYSADVYRPWQAIRVTSKKPCALIIPAPTGSLQIINRPDHVLNPCETAPITARVTNAAGTPLANVSVLFSTTTGQFTPSASAVTNTSGLATVNFRSAVCGLAQIGATATIGGRRLASQFVYATVEGWRLNLDLGKFAARTGEAIPVTATLRSCDQSSPISGKQITLTTNQGVFANGLTSYSAITDANGQISTTLTVTNCPVTATVTAEVTQTGCATGMKDYKTVSIECDNTRYDDWPMFQHDAQHDSLSITWDGAGPAMVQQWIADVPTCLVGRSSNLPNHPSPSGAGIFGHPYIDSSPVVVGNRVYVGTWSGTYASSIGSVRCYDAQTGTRLWETTVPMGGVSSTPCYYGGILYVGSADGKLYAINAGTGAVVWSRQTTDRSFPVGNGKIISSAVSYNGVIYITNEASKVYAYNTSGALQPGYPISLPTYEHGITSIDSLNVCGASSPAIANVGSYTYLLIGCDDGYFYRLRLNDRQLSSIYFGGAIESSPSVVGNYASVGVTWYLGANHRKVSIEPFKLVTTWYLTQECRCAPSISASGHMHAGVDTGRTLWKMDRASVGDSGNILGRFDAGTYFVGSASHTKSLVPDDDWLYTGNDDGWLYCLRESNMGPVWKTKLTMGESGGCSGAGVISTTPALAYNVDTTTHNRWLFVTSRTLGGKLFAFASQPGCHLVLTAPGKAEPCDTKMTITASYVRDGWPAANQLVTFTTTTGTFEESGTNIAAVQADSDGIARVSLQRPTDSNESDVSASAACNSNTLHIHWSSYTMNATANPAMIQPNGTSSITATLTDFDGTPIANKPVNLSTSNGTFADGTMNMDAMTDASGQVHTTLTLSSPGEATVTATHHLSCADYTDTVAVVCALDQWLSFQGSLTNTGVTVSQLGTNLVKKWSMPIAGNYNTDLWSSPITDGSSVWVATNSANGTIYRVLSDGTVMASLNLGSPVIGTPCLDPGTGTLYVTTQGGTLYSLNAANLNQNWTYSCINATEAIWGSPKFYGGAVYFVSTDATNSVSYLYVVDAYYGYLWNNPIQITGTAYYCSPGFDVNHAYGPRLYVAGARSIAAVDTGGYLQWQYNNNRNYLSSPSVYGGMVFVGNSGKEMGVEGLTDQGYYATWDREPLSTADPVWATPAAYNGKLYFGTDIGVSGFYICADQALWGFDWTFNSGTMRTSTLISPDPGLAFFANNSGMLYGLNLTSGSQDWTYNIRTDLGDPTAQVKSSFAAANNRMYIVAGTANARYLYCFGAP